jgi:hypothetical protein
MLLVDLAGGEDDVRVPVGRQFLRRQRGLGDLPYPPEYPKMPGEPKRVQPSKDTRNKQG